MTAVTHDANGLEVLGREECLHLLTKMPVGRIGVTIHALPVILPVNFALDGERVIVRSAAGSKLTAAMTGAVVALEVDDFDTMDHSGWSVLVQGRSRVMEDPDEIDRALLLPLRAWASDKPDRFITIDLELVSGRRVKPWDRMLAEAEAEAEATAAPPR